MANSRRTSIEENQLEGFGLFESLLPMLRRLHPVGAERDKAGNRELFFDQYCLLVLLFLFNPIVSSLRALQQITGLEKVRRRLGVKRTSLGSLSEASRVFDPELLREIILELGAQCEPLAKDPRLADVRKLTLVDGTLISAMPLLVEAMTLKHETGSGMVKWRLHTHFEVERYVPDRIEIARNGGGDNDERSVMERSVESDRCYVMDRGYAKFALFNQIHAADSSYVCRLRDNSSTTVVEDRPLTATDQAARVLSDQIVRFPQGKAGARPDHALRLIVVQISPHTKRGKYKGGSTGPGSDGCLRIATNLLDVPAEIIALIYAYRWTIEIFFRFLKQILGCRHLLSRDEQGIRIQVYCAIIACLLISLWTGRKPTKRTYEMLCYYFVGLASEAELLAHIDKLKRQDEQQRSHAN